MIKTQGIVFRAMKYRETSLIVDIYTKELGLRSYLINGVRSSKAKQSGNILTAMSQLDLLVYDKHGADKLNRISEFKLTHFYQKIPFDVIRGMMGQLMIEVLKKCLKDEEGNSEMYTFVSEWFDFLDTTKEPISNLLIVFLIELAGTMGFALDIERPSKESYFDLREGQFSMVVPGHSYYLDIAISQFLYQFIHSNKETAHEITISGKQRSILIDQLIIFYKFHVESFGELKSLEILRSILS